MSSGLLYRTHSFARAVLFGIVIVLLVLTFLGGCVGAPTSLESLATMEQSDFDRWTARVSNYSDAAASTALDEAPQAKDDLVRFCAIVGTLGGGSLPTDWKGPWVPLLWGEVQAWIDERGGLPTDARGIEVLSAIAAGVQRALDRR